MPAAGTEVPVRGVVGIRRVRWIGAGAVLVLVTAGSISRTKASPRR